MGTRTCATGLLPPRAVDPDIVGCKFHQVGYAHPTGRILSVP